MQILGCQQGELLLQGGPAVGSVRRWERLCRRQKKSLSRAARCGQFCPSSCRRHPWVHHLFQLFYCNLEVDSSWETETVLAQPAFLWWHEIDTGQWPWALCLHFSLSECFLLLELYPWYGWILESDPRKPSWCSYWRRPWCVWILSLHSFSVAQDGNTFIHTKLWISQRHLITSQRILCTWMPRPKCHVREDKENISSNYLSLGISHVWDCQVLQSSPHIRLGCPHPSQVEGPLKVLQEIPHTSPSALPGQQREEELFQFGKLQVGCHWR